MSRKKIIPLNQIEAPSLPDRTGLGDLYLSSKRQTDHNNPRNAARIHVGKQTFAKEQTVYAAQLFYLGTVLTLPIATFVGLFAWTFGIARFDFYYVPLTGLIALIIIGFMLLAYRKIASNIERLGLSMLSILGLYVICISPIIRALGDALQFGQGSLILAGLLTVATLASGATIFMVITYCVLRAWKTKTKLLILATLVTVCFSLLFITTVTD